MKRSFKEEDLKYLNGRIDRLWKKANKIEDLLFKWGKKYMELEDKCQEEKH